jgi:putative membrane protein
MATTLSSDDKDFITKAAAGSMAEVAEGREIMRKATSPDIRAYGQQMVTEHGKAFEELKQLAASKGVTIPAELDNEHKGKVDKLTKYAGNKLDQEYADDMVDDHEQDVKEFQKAAQDLKDADLRAWAAKTLPILENHLSMAKDIQTKTKKK